MPSPVLVGARVRLRPVTSTDADTRRRYGWHRAIERNYGDERPDGSMTEDEARAWVEGIQSEDSSTFWAIEVEGDLAGVAFLHSFRDVDRKARYAIGMFDPMFIGRGFGQEATRLVLAHAFDDLALHRVELRVLAFNTAAVTAYQKVGFAIEGVERDSCRFDGAWHDDVMMAILEDDYRAHVSQ